MKTTRTEPYKCPGCGRTNDAHANGEGHIPKKDDISICIECSYVGYLMKT